MPSRMHAGDEVLGATIGQDTNLVNTREPGRREWCGRHTRKTASDDFLHQQAERGKPTGSCPLAQDLPLHRQQVENVGTTASRPRLGSDTERELGVATTAQNPATGQRHTGQQHAHAGRLRNGRHGGSRT